MSNDSRNIISTFESVRAPSYLCEKEDKISCSSNLVQDALQALGFNWL